MATLLPEGKQSFSTSSGVPLVGGKVYTYDAGTNNPRATYSDAAGTVPNTNPVVLDARGEATIFWSGSYKIVLKDPTDVTIWTVDNVSGVSGADLASSAGAGLVGFLYATAYAAGSIGKWLKDLATYTGASFIGWVQSGVNPILRTIEEKLRDEKNLLDFTGPLADQRFANAKLSGVKWLRVPSGTYSTAGWAITEADSMLGLIFDDGAQLLLTTAVNGIALDIQKTGFKVRGCADVKSTGLISDGNNTIGIRVGKPIGVGGIGGKAYIQIDHIRHENFSARGFVAYQPVYLMIGRVDGYNSTYGISIEPCDYGGGTGIVGGTVVQVGRSYQSGCTRGINLERASWIELDMPIVEYCGNAVSTDGALHFVNCSNIVVTNRYGEQNARNIVRTDAPVTFIGGSMFAATAPDVVTYVGMAFGLRGSVRIDSDTIYARRISYDIGDTQDLMIGNNLVVPVAGGSVKFGNETMSVASGTLVSATWTTVAAIPASEYAAAVNTDAFYEYICYAGTSDLSTGFDAGTFMNGTLRSYSGALPAWLRFSGGNIQMLVTSTSYGLNYKIVLRRIFPG